METHITSLRSKALFSKLAWVRSAGLQVLKELFIWVCGISRMLGFIKFNQAAGPQASSRTTPLSSRSAGAVVSLSPTKPNLKAWKESSSWMSRIRGYILARLIAVYQVTHLEAFTGNFRRLKCCDKSGNTKTFTAQKWHTALQGEREGGEIRERENGSPQYTGDKNPCPGKISSLIQFSLQVVVK